MNRFTRLIRRLFENDNLGADFFGASSVADQEVDTTPEIQAPTKPKNHTTANPIRRIWIKNTKAKILAAAQKDMANLPKLQKELRLAATGATSPLFGDKPIIIPGKDDLFNIRRVIMAYAYDLLKLFLNNIKGTQKFDVLGLDPEDSYQLLPIANEIASYVADNLLSRDEFADYIVKYYSQIPKH